MQETPHVLGLIQLYWFWQRDAMIDDRQGVEGCLEEESDSLSALSMCMTLVSCWERDRHKKGQWSRVAHPDNLF